jgi:hypothetical protein
MDALNRLSPRAFGYKDDRKAAQAVRAATDALLAAGQPDALVALIERVWPATMQVNRANGDLDAAVHRAVELLEPSLLADADSDAHHARLKQLWLAIEADRGGVTDPLARRWGALCATRKRAGTWATELLPKVRRAWSTQPNQRCTAALPCLSAMITARRGPQLLAMFSVGGPTAWPIREFAAPLILRRDGVDAALTFAEAATTHGPTEAQSRAQFCEAALLKAKRRDEAWQRFALDAHQAHTHVHTHEALRRAYPEHSPRAVLEALVVHHPHDAGKLFATARAIGALDRATELAETSPGDPKVLLHAARDTIAQDRALATRWAWITLDWLASGRVYKITRKLIDQSCTLVCELDPDARDRLATVASSARAATTRNWIRAWLDGVLEA